MKKQVIFWIGIQESEIYQVTGLFSGSITIFGSGKNGNYAFDKKYNLRYNYNMDSSEWLEFVKISAAQIVRQYPDCSFLLYYPMDVTQYDKIVTDRVIAINDFQKLDLLDNKFTCREWFGNDVPSIPNEICYGEKITSEYSVRLESGQEFVVQGEYSCGGSDTWLLSNESHKYVFPRIEKDKNYSISPYLENSISLNVHIIVYANQLVILPASVQIIMLKECSFEYQGADFLTYYNLPNKIKDKVQEYAQIIGERLRRIGYRGICGIDFIATQSEVYFSEINPRFQSSSFILNFALNENGYQFSLQHLHIDAFSYDTCQYPLPEFKVEYSFFKTLFSNDKKDILKHLSNLAKTFEDVLYLDDDLSWEETLKKDTYLYKLVFKRNITAVSPEFDLIVHPNLRMESIVPSFDNIDLYMLELKIMLLSHGITIDSKTLARLEETTGVNCEEFEALDLIVNNKYYFNIPYQTHLSQLSPFIIKMVNNEFYIFYCETKLVTVSIRGIDPISNKLLKNGLEISEIAYLGQDRLRIYHRLGCYFKDNKMACGFCDIPSCGNTLDFELIKEAIDAYDTCSNIKHYLIGGGSQSPKDKYELVCRIAKYIKNKNEKPIYLMSLPINDKNVLADLKNSGITEVAFNIEIFDRGIAEKYMPGKGKIPLQTYLEALEYAVAQWGKTGNVRSIFIVGLEPSKSLLSGVETVCKIGVSPILTLFKPIQGTPLEHVMPPSDNEILFIVKKTEELCEKYGVTLGPNCICCEDNTLKLQIN